MSRNVSYVALKAACRAALVARYLAHLTHYQAVTALAAVDLPGLNA